MNYETKRLHLKRLHLFEIEDLAICPDWIRDRVTSMIVVVHRWLGVPRIVADQLGLLLADTDGEAFTIVDVCSGNGGPLPDALELMVVEQSFDRRVELVLTDLRPPSGWMAPIRGGKDKGGGKDKAETSIQYFKRPLNACMPLMEQLGTTPSGGGDSLIRDGSLVIRTLVCGFHHLAPEHARLVLLDAQTSKQPLVIFELTDGTVPPRWLWWVTLPPNFLFGLLVSLFTWPVTVRGLVFSFLVPIIPACFAWDGAVTSARTYREAELYDLVRTLPASQDYQWEFKTVPGLIVQHSLIIGRPV